MKFCIDISKVWIYDMNGANFEKKFVPPPSWMKYSCEKIEQNLGLNWSDILVMPDYQLFLLHSYHRYNQVLLFLKIWWKKLKAFIRYPCAKFKKMNIEKKARKVRKTPFSEQNALLVFEN